MFKNLVVPTKLQNKGSGQLYALLLGTNIIKVGRTSIGEKRFKRFTNVTRSFLSNEKQYVSMAESILIDHAMMICGFRVENSNEFFYGGAKRYYSIVEIINEIKVYDGLTKWEQMLVDVDKEYPLKPFVSGINV